MRTVFLLGSGRSGTRFLCDLFRHNADDCVAVHEPYLRASAPAMFGKPIYDYTFGNHRAVKRVFERKRRGILRYKTTWYVETNHAFLKSFADAAIEAFPDMKLIHVVRDPLRTAVSETNRELGAHRIHFPLRKYRGDNGEKYFRWSLTREEPIFHGFDLDKLSLFQKYVIQWIEIENRAQRFLDRNDKHGDCYLLHVPPDLNNPERIKQMLSFFGIKTKNDEILIKGVQNRTPRRPSVVGTDEQRQFRDIIEAMPNEHLEVFNHQPYSNFSWVKMLRK